MTTAPTLPVSVALLGLILAGQAPAVHADPSDNYQQPLDTGSADPDRLLRELQRGLDRLRGSAAAAVAPPQRSGEAAPTATGAFIAPRAACPGNELTREETTELQAVLNEILGDEAGAGAIDGLCGTRTRAAITRFEQMEGMPQRGAPTRAVLARVREVGATVANRALQEAASVEGRPTAGLPDDGAAGGSLPPP
jgi:peptidoglycan hydrolase-like protein with peptidoglycan-binding domain